MSGEPLQPVYLLAGTDRPKIKRALTRLRGRFPSESVELLSADTVSGADTAASAHALGLFGPEGARLIVVEGVERWRADDVTAVTDYLAAPVATSVMALVAEGALKPGPLVQACERAGRVLRFDVPKPRDPSGWVRSEFERLGARVDADAARALVEIVGGDVTELEMEAEKIATWAAGRPIERRDVELLAVSAGETFVWAVTDAWGNRDAAGVLGACEALLETKGKEPFVVAAALASHVGKVRAAQVLGREGLGPGDVAKRLRMKEYPARKALQHGKNYTLDELDQALVRLAELDAALKGASRLPAELELERALVEVTAAREAAEPS